MEISPYDLEDKYMISQVEIKTQELMMNYPPRFFDDRKKLVYEVAVTGAGELLNNRWGNQAGQKERVCQASNDQKITSTRWKAMQLPIMFPPKNSVTEYLMREDVFQYDHEFGKEPGHIEWYLNFADADLFLAYGGSLLAQDELQVAEHPVLGSLREMLLDISEKEPKYAPCTRDDDGNSTPFIIRGVERRLSLSIEANVEEGRPHGLYGNMFSSATEDAIRRACRPIIPPSITNLIAIEAPSGGKNEYTLAQIADIFITAYTAFMAAKHAESYFIYRDTKWDLDPRPTIFPALPVVTIHTGNWGTGAYGGNKIIMALLQLAAARAANIDRMVYHTFSNEYSNAYRAALDLLTKKLIPGDKRIKTQAFLKQIQAIGFRWGVSDGN